MKPPKDVKELYEVDDKLSAVKGSRKMAHTDQLMLASRPSTPPSSLL